MEVTKSGAARKRSGDFKFTPKSTSAFKAPRRSSQQKSVRAIAKEVFVDSMEHKYRDTSFVGGALPITNNGTSLEVDPGTLNCLNAIDAGDGASEREGKQVTMTSIQILGNVRYTGVEGTGTTPHSGQSVFIALVWDKRTNRAQLNSEDVFTNIMANIVGSGHLIRNPNDMKRYKVLKTWRLEQSQQNLLKEQVGVADQYTWNEQMASFEFFHKFKKPIKVRYVDTTTSPSTCGQIMDNSLHMIATFSSSDTAIAPVLNYVSRVRFVDG